MREPFSLTIDQQLFEKLYEHLFPGDGDEHGAVIAAGISESSKGTRLLAREVFLAKDNEEYVPGKRGYRALTAQFVAETSGFCAEEQLCYLAVHCHTGTDSVEFSPDDVASHKRGYPALLDITKGGPVGALVFAKNAIAGDIWTKEGRFELEHTRIVGTYTYNLYPGSHKRPNRTDIIYDRNTKLFGDLGQEILSDLKVGIIGLGGGGSLLNEWLSRLGVGKIIAVDFDRVDRTNLPRVVGATRWEAKTFLTKSGIPLLQKVGKRFSRHKVKIARKVARTSNAKIDYQAIVGNILDEPTAKLLKDVDFLFLATDSIQSRLVFNALVHQYLIPGIQIGIKIPKDSKTQKVGDITANTRPVFPQAQAGCLECHDLIPASKLQEESLTEEQLKIQRYVDDDTVSEPSVITLNILSAAQAANDLMMVFTGLYEEGIVLEHQINFARKRELNNVELYSNPRCPDCSNASFSRRARGDRTRLPCRANKQ